MLKETLSHSTASRVRDRKVKARSTTVNFGTDIEIVNTPAVC